MAFALFRRALVMVAALGLATPILAETPPHVSVASVEALPRPLPLPYDDGANADRRVADAMARAKASHKKLLIDMGGNWCLDCRVMAAILQLPEMHVFLARHFEIITLNVGRMDANLQIAAHYGIKHLDGVPAVFIIDPQSDKLLNRDHLFALADARSMTPQALADWLAQYS